MLVCLAIVSFASTANAGEQTSWGVVAIDGGEIVEVEVGAKQSVRVLRSLCSSRRIKQSVIQPVWRSATYPGPGSQLLGILSRKGKQDFFSVPDIGWTRWALEVSPIYLQSVCDVGAGKAVPSRALRVGWRDLLKKIDQRARDEASRLAYEFPPWAKDLSAEELTDIVQSISLFPTPEAEALRWIIFLRRIPPGPNLLALLQMAEASSKPFFGAFLKSFRQLRAKDKAFLQFCKRLPLQQRPDACPPMLEKRR